MLALAKISLEASCPESNRFRAYRISVGRDLFGDWTVTTGYGRIGCKGRERMTRCTTLAQAKRLVSTTLCKRMSAPRRIGCSYQIVSLVDAPEIALEEIVPAALAGMASGGCLDRLGAAGPLTSEGEMPGAAG